MNGQQTAVGTVSRGLALLVAGAMFMEIMDGTVIAPAAPHIGETFGVPAVAVNVAITAYVLSVAVLIPISGWLADRYGARRIFTAAIAWFVFRENFDRRIVLGIAGHRGRGDPAVVERPGRRVRVMGRPGRIPSHALDGRSTTT